MKIFKIKKKNFWDWETVWNEYSDMVYGVAHLIIKKYGRAAQVEFNELVSEGWLAIIRKSEEHYNPEKGAKSTWIYVCSYNAMTKYCIKKIQQYRCVQSSCLDWEDEDGVHNNWEPTDPDKQNWIRNLLEEVGEEAGTLIRTILKAPEELSKVLSPKAPNLSYNAIESYMIDTLDWSFEEFHEAERELSRQLKKNQKVALSTN